MRLSALLAFVPVVALAGTPTTIAPATKTGTTTTQTLTAVAELQPRSGSTTTGSVTFTQTGDSVKVHIELKGATPGNHAVHIHEKGDCSAPDASSAGSHFNPMGHMHGDATSAEHHPGDFGNLTVGSEGTGVKDLTVSGFTLAAGQQMSVGNLAVIVHEKPDDFSQPTGNAGARQACGVILVK